MASATRLEVRRDASAASAGSQRAAGLDWQPWLILLAGGLLLRLVFYTGYFGSDEVTYTQFAFNLLKGDWEVSDYVGANRYGVNLPVAGFGLLFGQNEVAAALYSLVCSLAEVAIVFYFGQRMLGRKAGFLAAAILAFIPIHVHYAGRLMADAPLALAVTASFLFFWAGETRGRARDFAAAGLAAGLAFWIKPVAMVYLAVFLTYPLLFRRWNWKWGWMVAAFAAAMLANSVFFWTLTGRPLFLFEALQARQSSAALESGSAPDSPWYYLVYLFAKIYHTWILGYLALLAGLSWLVSRKRGLDPQHPAVGYVVWWSLGLLVVLSLFVVSWRPFLLIPKQANYMLMFMAPLALLAGHILAQWQGVKLRVAVLAMSIPCVLLAGMEQNVVRVFTANSKAVLDFSRDHAASDVFVNTNAFRAMTFENLVKPDAPIANVHFVGDLRDVPIDKPDLLFGRRRYVIIDTETLSWGSHEPFTSLAAVPSCWLKVGVLKTVVTGFGTRLLDSWRPALVVLPGSLRDGAERRLEGLIRPAAAHVFEIPVTGCAREDFFTKQPR